MLAAALLGSGLGQPLSTDVQGCWLRVGTVRRRPGVWPSPWMQWLAESTMLALTSRCPGACCWHSPIQRALLLPAADEFTIFIAGWLPNATLNVASMGAMMQVSGEVLCWAAHLSLLSQSWHDAGAAFWQPQGNGTQLRRSPT